MEENKSLWFMLDEMKSSQNSIGEVLEQMVKESLEVELFKSFKNVGEA